MVGETKETDRSEKTEECGEQKRDEPGERIPKARDMLPHWQLNGVCHKRCHHLISTSPQTFISPPHDPSSSVPMLFPPLLLPRSLS